MRTGMPYILLMEYFKEFLIHQPRMLQLLTMGFSSVFETHAGSYKQMFRYR